MRLCIVDTKSANFNSVVQALKRLGVEATISADLSVLKQADKLIMPGVGSATAVMKGLLNCSSTDVLLQNEQGLKPQGELVDFILNYRQPLLGICLGMQVQAQASEEVPLEGHCKQIATLGLVQGTVHRLHAQDASTGEMLPLPHMGWNTIQHQDHPLFKGIPQNSYFYFVHSFALDVGANTIATCNYSQDFSAAVARDNFMGVQFHPEKSGTIGAQLLQNFLEL